MAAPAAEPRFAYAYALALADAQQREEGIDTLRVALARFPDDLDLLEALALLLRDAGRSREALDIAKRRARGNPEDQRALDLVTELSAVRDP